MARYIKNFQTNAAFQTVHMAINQYLLSEGYEYINYNGESVFKKGNGVMTSPTFFKFSYFGNTVRMETWMTYVLLPGLYIGELDVDCFWGWAVKGTWKKQIKNLENILSNFAAQTTCQQPVQNNMAYNDNHETLQSNVSYQKSVPQSNSFISDDNPIPPTDYPVSRKEFINKYANPSLRKNITSIAILCYLCAGVTFVVSCLYYPLGCIDALILAGLALGMHLAKSKVCATFILVLSIIEVLLSMDSGSVPVLWLIVGISAVTTFNKIEKAYKEFIKR